MGLWLARQGVTSLVLKYRTYNTDAEGFSLSWNDYAPQVYADAKQAIYTLRSQAKELDIDENKIGIAGFSAGGSLSLTIALEIHENELPAYAKGGHGFDSGLERGYGICTWRESFIAWLKDAGFINE